jgi:hypothetical protein
MHVRKDDLYGLPVEEFTKARDELANELRKAGKKEAADEVKALRKPSVSAWAVNQAVRRRPQDAKALVKAGDELRKAQRGVVGGRGGPSGLRDATAAHRRLVEELTEEGRAALEERGAAAAATVTRVAQTLRAASIDKETSKALTAGTLAEDVEQAGFGPLLAAVPPGARPKRRAAAKPAPKPRAEPKAEPKAPPKPKRDPNAARRKRLEEQLEHAQARVRELQERLERLQ